MNDETQEEFTTELNRGEMDLYFWQYHKLGGYMTSIFDAMAMADTVNLNLLALGYPEQVQAYKDYGNKKGYWESVRIRMEK